MDLMSLYRIMVDCQYSVYCCRVQVPMGSYSKCRHRELETETARGERRCYMLSRQVCSSAGRVLESLLSLLLSRSYY